MIAEPAIQAAFPVGWYGKIPGAGDFIARRVPPAFSETWDRWLQQALAETRERLGAHWRDAYLTMSPWRFLLSPGMVNANAWAGVMLPSVDAVGRYFPLTVATSLPAASFDLPAMLLGTASWFDDIEGIALSALSPNVKQDGLEAALSRRPFLREWLQKAEDTVDATIPERSARAQMLALTLPARTAQERPSARISDLALRFAEPCGVWLAEATDLLDRSLLLCESLPSSELFCAMMDGRWPEHGWSHHDLRRSA
jgi:type VI secretion system protein ImpM